MIQNQFPNVFFFSTKFMNNFDNNFQLRLRWAADIDLLSLEKIFWPINVNNNHWVLACCFMQEHTIILYDSLNGGQNYRFIFNNLKKYLNARLDTYIFWKTIIAQNIPLQENGFDYGVYVIKYAFYLVRNISFRFSQVKKN